VIHYHGTPITPFQALHELAGRCFCVSFARPDHVRQAHTLGQAVMLDNGAYSFWRKDRETDWAAYMDWAEPWLDYATTWAVIPDVIAGSEAENDALLVSWFERRLPKGAPVWHLHESLERLRRLAHGYDRLCLGSSGRYRTIGSPDWHRRISEAFDVIADPDGRVPWVHMLRGMSQAGGPYPFGSVDSTDIARNHNRRENTAGRMAERHDARQCPARWLRSGTQQVLLADDEVMA
jgi:hypothetical protein